MIKTDYWPEYNTNIIIIKLCVYCKTRYKHWLDINPHKTKHTHINNYLNWTANA